MIPQFGQCYERFEVLEGQNAKVSDAYAYSRQRSVKASVQMVEAPKREGIKSAPSLSEDCLRAIIVRIRSNQLYHTVWRVLPVSVHHDHGVTSSSCSDMGESDGDGPLVPKIDP